MPMPVLEATDSSTSRAAARRHPTPADDADQQGKARASAKTALSTIPRRASRLASPDTEDGDEAAAQGSQPATLPKPSRSTQGNVRRSRRRWHPLVYLGAGMIGMLVLWTLVTMAISWGKVTLDDLRYGRPRTFQVDAVVGHDDSPGNPSHFIAINLKGRIEIIEFPGGDGSKARIYLGPQLYDTGSDLVPVTLSFVDVSGNHHPDMILRFENTQLVFVNDNGGFRPATSQELPAIQRYLQQHGQ
jgi:hypothetical protein